MRNLEVFALLTFALFTVGSAAGAAGTGELTPAELKALENGVAGYTLMDIRRNYEKSGPEVLKPAILSLLAGGWKLLTQKSFGEEGEILGEYLWLLGKTGDPRTRPFFLAVMVDERVGGRVVAEGLIALGRSVLPAIEDSLSSPRARSRAGAAGYIGDMAEIDSAGVFFTPQDRKRIAGRLAKLLASPDQIERMSAVHSLGVLGDRSHLPALEEIRRNDPGKTPNGLMYTLRGTAERAIEKIKRRENGAK